MRYVAATDICHALCEGWERKQGTTQSVSDVKIVVAERKLEEERWAWYGVTEPHWSSEG